MKLLLVYFSSLLPLIIATPSARVIGGYEIDITEVPYLVAIDIKTIEGGDQLRCVGAILDKRFILTAAHCIIHLHRFSIPFNATIRTGSNYFFQDGFTRHMEGYAIHPQYGKIAVYDSDYAILLADSDLVFDDKQKPVKLPNPGDKLEDGHELLIAGWGRTETVMPEPMHLRAIKLPKFNKEKCKDYYTLNDITDRKMCAGYAKAEDNERMNVGDGDSGAPVVSTTDGAVYGIVSNGHRKSPAVFARVQNVLQWIDNVVTGKTEMNCC